MKDSNISQFRKGFRYGIPIAMGYFAVSFALGIAARSAGMSAFQAAIMSALMLASAGQYAAITIIAAAGSLPEMALTTLIVNLRYLLMACSLSQKVDPGLPLLHRFGISYTITDEIFGVAMAQEGKLNPFFNYGAVSIAAPGWVLGAFLGTSAGNILPVSVSNALGVALYGMFLAIIIPPTRKSPVIAGIVVLSMAASYLFSIAPMLSAISSGMQIIILTLIIAGIAAFLFPISDSE